MNGFEGNIGGETERQREKEEEEEKEEGWKTEKKGGKGICGQRDINSNFPKYTQRRGERKGLFVEENCRSDNGVKVEGGENENLSALRDSIYIYFFYRGILYSVQYNTIH